MLWNDLCSEYDARNLLGFLNKLGHRYTEEFLAFVSVWQRDEWNHYLGFRFIYHLFYGESEAQIHAKAASRYPNFSAISEFLRDEFVTCLLMAYDEIATMRGPGSVAVAVVRALA